MTEEAPEQRVERLARVLYDIHFGGHRWDRVREREREDVWRRQARAVIASDTEAGLVTVPKCDLLAIVADAESSGEHLSQAQCDEISGRLKAIAAHEQEGGQ